MNKNALYGLVMCGGKSSRMGTDKSRIVYQQKEQQYHVYEMLQILCEKVFISCNAEQGKTIDLAYNFIIDEPEFDNVGPMSGLLSALKKMPHTNLLVIGCDYPYVTIDVLKGFVKSIKQTTIAAAFYNEEQQLYEPLLAYYSAQSLEILLHSFKENNFSLQYFLRNILAEKYTIKNHHLLKSVDDKKEMLEVKKQLNK